MLGTAFSVRSCVAQNQSCRMKLHGKQPVIKLGFRMVACVTVGEEVAIYHCFGSGCEGRKAGGREVLPIIIVQLVKINQLATQTT